MNTRAENPPEDRDGARRTVVITGGTGGLGYQTAKAIATAGDSRRVVITGRKAAVLERAVTMLSADTRANVVGMPLDLGSLTDVRRFAADLLGDGLPPLCAIVCNAGIQVVSGTATTIDGFEQTFGVNHLAHFLLVRELLPHLIPPARIVVVSSDTHNPAKHTGMPAPRYTNARSLALPDHDGTEKAGTLGRRRYTTSKLCNVLMTYELARRLSAANDADTPDITVNAFDPGLMPGTGLTRDYGRIQALAWRYVLPALTVIPGLGVHTPRASAAALARLVIDPGMAGTTGRYFSGRREIRSSEDSYDLAKAADLWETGAELVDVATQRGNGTDTVPPVSQPHLRPTRPPRVW